MSKVGFYKKQSTGYQAFIPNKFPPDGLINWDENLILLLSQADQAIGGLNAIDQLIPDVDFFILMYIRKEAALSTQIEGTQATLLDLVKAEAKISDNDTPSDVNEIQNYIKAMNYGIGRLKDLPLSLRLIREIHQVLLQGVRGQHRNPGEFRSSQNWIGGPTIETATFVPPPPHEMTQSLYDLEKFMNDEILKLPPLIKTALVHAQFETIHPFLDGNGRTGRLLITFYLYKLGVLPRPLLYLSDFFQNNRRNYYDKLNSYRFDKGVEGWLKFFLQGISQVSNEAVEKAKKITNIKEKDVQVVSGFGKNADAALTLLKKMYTFPIVNAKVVSKITGIMSKSNVNSLIDKFVKSGILKEMTGRPRNRTFIYLAYTEQFTS